MWFTMLCNLDPNGIENRKVSKKRKKKKQPFVSDGPDWVYFFDGHDKLMGYQNWTFPVAVYGCLDTFSHHMKFIFVWNSNSDPQIIGQQYIKHLYLTRRLSNFVRLDRGTETGKLAAIHTFLCGNVGDMEDPTDSVIFGPSTSNNIEHWWRDLHEGMKPYFKHQLSELLSSRDYDPHCLVYRSMLSYIFIPLLQRECDVFVDLWNSHRI